MKAYDLAGNVTPINVSFTYDAIAPAPPTLNPVQSLQLFPSSPLSGAKEAKSSIWINGSQVVPINDSTSWTYQIP